MDAGLIDRIESNVEHAVSALFAAAAGFAAWAWLEPVLVQPAIGAWTVGAWTFGAGAFGYLACRRLLAAFGSGEPQFRIAAFDVVDPEFQEFGELILTRADRLDFAPGAPELVLTDADRLDLGSAMPELVLTDADRLAAAEDGAQLEPLVLDDILADLGPDARVVRLFDRRAMPTPGQLKSRIDSHLEQGIPGTAAPDASQALSDALAELRRSLR
jgi:hypothetical protein